MSSPGQYYQSLPPVTKAYGVLCLMTTTACHLQLLDYQLIWLSYESVLKQFQGPFKQRTADFLWMMIFGALSLLVIGLIPTFRYFFMAPSLPFMILYVWSREMPDSVITISGFITIRGFYLPWAMLALDIIFNNPFKPDIMGILVGHLYYFMAVIHPLSGGSNILKTPLWVHKLVAYWGKGTQMNSPVNPNRHAGIAFRGRSYRLGQ